MSLVLTLVAICQSLVRNLKSHRSSLFGSSLSSDGGRTDTQNEIESPTHLDSTMVYEKQIRRSQTLTNAHTTTQKYSHRTRTHTHRYVHTNNQAYRTYRHTHIHKNTQREGNTHTHTHTEREDTHLYLIQSP